MFLDCKNHPPARPAIGDSFFHVKFPNRYIDVPNLQNKKKSDPELKNFLKRPAFMG